MSKSMTKALERQSEAVSLFCAAKTFEQIAEKVRYANRGTVHRVVKKAFKERIIDDIDFYRDTEVVRLDAIHDKLWAMMTDAATTAERVRAAAGIVKVIDQRAN